MIGWPKTSNDKWRRSCNKKKKTLAEIIGEVALTVDHQADTSLDSDAAQSTMATEAADTQPGV